MALLINSLILNLISLYSILLIIWAFGSWFPRFTITPFYKFINRLVEPYARLFRGIIPPIGGFDFSIMLAFAVLVYLIPPILNKIFSFFILAGV